ncbi:carbohydrate ABC transporter permease [Occultella glacieicola]|nr:sugar ABC transporter permease [Occultella glacieicola]
MTTSTLERTSRRPQDPQGPAAGRRRRTRQDWSGYVFLLPWFGGMLFTVVPFLWSLYLSFTDYNLLNPPEFSGLDNIRRMVADTTLHHSLVVTFTYTFVSVPLSLAAALAVAVLLNKGMGGLRIYRSVFYLPSLIGSSVAVVMLWRAIFGANGIVNDVLERFGIATQSWIGSPDTALGVLISLNVWTFGAPMVIFLAALRQVPAAYYEAAALDGASRWRQFRSVTMPLISPVVFFNLVLAIIGSMQTFTQGYVVSNGTGGPSDSTLFYNLYLYQQGFGNFDMGYASAMAWLLLVIIAAFTAINFLAQKYWVHYEN